MEKKNTTSFIIVLVLILLGVVMYAKWPAKTTPPPAAPEDGIGAIPEDQLRHTYPKYYPEELAFDLSQIQNIAEAKGPDGKSVVTVEYTSINPISDFSRLVRTVLELKKWTITGGATGDKPTLVVATRGTETVAVNMTETTDGKGTIVKINYQQ